MMGQVPFRQPFPEIGGKQPAMRRMAEKLATPEGRKRCARRKWLSEAPNGWIKEAMGFRRFSVRGLAKVRGEWIWYAWPSTSGA